jgi:L-ascorbate metabolism protein UlaG (beta-lactamase superfamily)
MPTRRDALALFVLPAAALTGARPALAASAETALKGDAIPTSGGDVIIHPVNHASLVLGYKDAVIYVDPVGGAARYGGLPRPTAILVTHGHPDHLDVPTLAGLGAAKIGLTAPKVVIDALPEALRGGARLLANGDAGEIGGLPVTAVPAYNITPDRLRYHPKGVGNGYVIRFADKAIYVAGDTEDVPEMRALSGVDVAFLPMNLPFTMTVEQAADATRAFKPRIVYPYHHKGSDLKKFSDLVGEAAEVRIADWYA